MSDNPHPTSTPGVDYEQTDVSINWLMFSIIALFVTLVVSMMLTTRVLGGLQDYRAATEATPLPLIELRPTPPAPRLQPNPIDRKSGETDLVEMLERQDEILTGYGWINEEAGTVRIPIDQAIDILGEQEEPAR